MVDKFNLKSSYLKLCIFAKGQAICENAGFNVIDVKRKSNMLYNRKKIN